MNNPTGPLKIRRGESEAKNFLDSDRRRSFGQTANIPWFRSFAYPWFKWSRSSQGCPSDKYIHF